MVAGSGRGVAAMLNHDLVAAGHGYVPVGAPLPFWQSESMQRSDFRGRRPLHRTARPTACRALLSVRAAAERPCVMQKWATRSS